MSWQPEYITVDQLKSLTSISDAVDDSLLQLAIQAASRAVDDYCERQFGKVATQVARYYSPTGILQYYQTAWTPFTGYGRVAAYEIDDLMDLDDLVVKKVDADGAWTVVVDPDDYYLAPMNAIADGHPWNALISKGLLPREGTLEVTARYGWDEIPDKVIYATLLQASRLFSRRNAPFGVAGSAELGSELRLFNRVDADVEVLLRPLKRQWGMV